MTTHKKLSGHGAATSSPGPERKEQVSASARPHNSVSTQSQTDGRRRLAERGVRAERPAGADPDEGAAVAAVNLKKLVRELQARVAELEHENETLRGARDTYAELYDAAPAGKRDAEDVKALRELLQTVVDRLPVCVGLLRGSDLRIELVNPAYQKVAPGKQMLGKTLDEVWGETGQDFTAICRRVLETGEPHEVVDEPKMISRSAGGPVEKTYFTWWLHRVPLPGNRGWALLDTAWDTTERKQVQERLAADLDAMNRLQKVGSLYVLGGDLEPVVAEIVEAAIAITGADFGNSQLIDPATGNLQIVAQRGFPEWWLDYWNTVTEGKGACGTALERRERVIVENVENSPIFAGTPALEIQLRAGVHAVQSTPLVGRSGKPLGMLSTHFRTPQRPDEHRLRLLDLLARQAADIIERAQAEAALREREEKLALAASGTSIGIYERDLVTGEVVASDQSVRLLGLNTTPPPTPPPPTLSQQYHYRDWAKRVHPADLPRVEAEMDRCLTERAPFEYEYRVVWPDGSAHWIVARGLFQFDSNGRPCRALGILMDISSRKAAEDAVLRLNEELEQRVELRTAELAASEAKFRNLAEGSPNAILIIQQDRIVYASPACERMLGYTREDLYRPDFDFLRLHAPASAALVKDRYARQMQGENEAPCEVTLVAKNGQEIDAILATNVIDHEGGRAILSVITDITARRRAERLQIRQQKQLRRLAARLASSQDDEQRRIAEGLHDDVAQVLTACSIKMGVAERAENAAELRAIHDEIDLLLTEASEKVRSLSFELLSATLYRLGLRAAIHELCEGMLVRYGIRFHLEGGEHAKDLDEAVTTVVYKAVRELLFNVVKHAGVREAWVRMSMENDTLELRVEDHGRGFPKDWQSRQTGVSEGMGLVAARERMREIGGKMRVESVPGVRTRVTLCAPVGEPRAIADPQLGGGTHEEADREYKDSPR